MGYLSIYYLSIRYGLLIHPLPLLSQTCQYYDLVSGQFVLNFYSLITYFLTFVMTTK